MLDSNLFVYMFSCSHQKFLINIFYSIVIKR